MWLKKLEKIVADTKREFEKQKSSLTASTPQQVINLLIRSLPAQIDDQRIDLNNKISVSM